MDVLNENFNRFIEAIMTDYLGTPSEGFLYFNQSFYIECVLLSIEGVMLKSHSIRLDCQVPIITRIAVFNVSSILLVYKLII